MSQAHQALFLSLGYGSLEAIRPGSVALEVWELTDNFGYQATADFS